MSSPLKVLIVSNSEDHPTILLSLLEKGGYASAAQWVNAPLEFEEVLEAEEWDIIFCEHYIENSGESFGAEAAWRLLQASSREVPFIVIGNSPTLQTAHSLSNQEDTVIKLLQQGVTDYIDDLNYDNQPHSPRLLQVLARELIGKKARQANIQDRSPQDPLEINEWVKIEDALEGREEVFHLISQVNNDAVWDWQKSDNRLWWSPGFHTLFGYDMQSLVPTWDFWVSLINPEDILRVTSMTQEIMNSSSTSSAIEYRFRRQDGSYAYVLDRLNLIRNDQGEVERMIGSMIDLSDRYHFEKRLRTMQERYELAICAGNVGIWDWNLEQVEFYIDTNLKTTLGYTELDIPNSLEAWYGLIHPEDRGLVMAAIQDYLEGITPSYAIEHRKIHKNGEVLWFLSQGVAFAGAGDQIIRMAGTETEITKRKHTETALQEKALLLDLANDSIIVRDLLDQITFWNQKAVEVYGYTAQEAIGKYLYDLLPTAFPQRSLAIKKQLLTQGRWEGELIQTKRDGAEITVSSRQALQLDMYGNPRQVLEINTDITAAKQAKATLQEANRRWQSLLDNIQLVVVGTDQDGVLEYANPFFLQLTGYTKEEVLGVNWLEKFIPPVYQSDLKEKTLANTENFTPYYQNPILTKVGEERMIAWNNTLLRNPDGTVSSVMSIGEDITDRQIVNRMKDEFISVISHELRTPLTAIRGSLGLLAGGFLAKHPEKAQRMIEIAAENTDRLTRLINDILDIERIEAGKMDLEINPCSPLEMIQYTLTTLQPLASKVDVSLELGEVSPIIQETSLLADRDRLLQVLTNLVSNAIKFSPPQGKIEVTARMISCLDRSKLPETPTPVLQKKSVAVNSNTFQVPDQAQEDKDSKYCPILPSTTSQHILFQVKDQGGGIPTDKLESIFDRFQQVDASDSRSKGGTGLGLTICRNIIRRHGGAIWAESQLGAGSSFFFSLPMEIPESVLSLPQEDPVIINLPIGDLTTHTQSPITINMSRKRSYKVLVVEDDLDLAKVLLTTFEHLGIHAYHATTGRMAIKMIQEVFPDLLLLDLVLPEGNGFAVIDWLRMSRSWSELPLIVYSALELTPQERDRASLGITECFTKSITNPEELGKRAISLLEG
jgi:PAS domain S-box-containing protein